MIDTDMIIDCLSSFKDPYTEIEYKDDGNKLYIDLIVNSEKIKYIYDKTNGGVNHVGSKKLYTSFLSLAASEKFSNLNKLALLQTSFNIDTVDIPQKFYIRDGSQENEINGYKELYEELGHIDIDKLNIFLIDGPAGVGKTHFIKKLCDNYARAYLKNGTRTPILYVSSRGQRLSNLDNLLAASIQNVRASFTYDQVPFLMRLGLLNLAIDGFDELVDSDGYRDSWYALREFLRKLNGKGVCFLSGRDTFFEHQGFLKQLGELGGNFSFKQITVMEPTLSEAQSWLQNSGWSSEMVTSSKNSLLFHNSYALRPYFLRELGKISDFSVLNTSLRTFIIKNFIERESKILSEKIDIPSDKIEKLLFNFFVYLSLDMAARESDEVDNEYIEFICEFVFKDELNPSELAKIKHKATSFAFLENNYNAKGCKQFPHNEIRNYFLSFGIVDEVINDYKTSLAIRKNIFGSDFCLIFQDIINDIEKTKIVNFVCNLKEYLINSSQIQVTNSNISALLVCSAFFEEQDEPCELSNLVCSEFASNGVFPIRVKMENCFFYNFDARQSSLCKVNFHNTKVDILIIDEKTVFSESMPTFESIFMYKTGGKIISYNTNENIDELINSIKIVNSDSINTKYEFYKYFEKVCHKANRQFYLSHDEDGTVSNLLRNKYWNSLVEILEKFDRITIKDQQKSGSDPTLYHIHNPIDLIYPKDDDLQSIEIKKEILKVAPILG